MKLSFSRFINAPVASPVQTEKPVTRHQWVYKNSDGLSGLPAMVSFFFIGYRRLTYDRGYWRPTVWYPTAVAGRAGRKQCFNSWLYDATVIESRAPRRDRVPDQPETEPEKWDWITTRTEATGSTGTVGAWSTSNQLAAERATFRPLRGTGGLTEWTTSV